MWTKTLALGAFAALCVENASAIKVLVTNLCNEEFDLSHLGQGRVVSVEKFAPGSTVTKELPMGSPSQLFKAGTTAQATLAEITVMGGKVWMDISIIPTGVVGPGYCPTFEECKRVTQGHSYNYPMQILPMNAGQSGQFPTCGTITCMNDGCPEAYLFPKDDTKTRVCPGNTDLQVTFCPGGTGGKTDPPTPPPTTPAPTTPEPTTPAPTTPEPTTPAPAVNESSVLSFDGFMGSSGSGSAAVGAIGEERSFDPDTDTAAEAGAATEAPPVVEVTPVAAPEAGAETAVQEVTTRSSGETSTGAGVYVLLSVGAAAMVAASAIFVLRKKKMALEAMDQKTPRPTTTAANAFMLTTPQETTVL